MGAGIQPASFFCVQSQARMTTRIRTWIVAFGAAVIAAPAASAWMSPGSTTTRHLTVTTSTSTATAAPGARVSLVVEIVPKPAMHVYAPGQKDFIPVSLTLAANRAVTAEPVQFPAPERLTIKELGETHLVYSKPFRIVQNVTLAKDAAGSAAGTHAASVTVKGTLKYQACDDSICYAPVSVPVAWTVALQNRPDRARPTSVR
jgi:DsbC/DsbD-like thiol-disulfide interchange protein